MSSEAQRTTNAAEANGRTNETIGVADEPPDGSATSVGDDGEAGAKSDGDATGGHSDDGGSPSRDAVFDVLANRRRRYVLHHLRREDGTAELGLLAEAVAAWENDVRVSAVTSGQRKRLYTALQQFHLPKMDDAGLLVYDRRGVVSLTDSATDIDVYLDIVPGGEIPWSRYYLGLSALNGALLIGLWLDAVPLTLLPDLAWIACFVAILAGSAAVHAYRDRWMRLGTRERPPEFPSR